MNYKILFLLLLFASCSVEHNDRAVPIENLNVGIWSKYNFSKKQMNASYGDKERLKYDFYRPHNLDKEKLPLLIFVHGGAFVMGDKRNYIITKFTQDFCRSGFATASVNYRIIGGELKDGQALINKGFTRKKIMEAVGDVKKAVKYFRENSNDLNIDSDNIFLVGFSAGAIISSHIIFTNSSEATDYMNKGEGMFKNTIDNIDIFDDDPKSLVKGVVSISGGVMDFFDLEDTDLIDMPYLLIHGNNDKIVPISFDNPMGKFAEDDLNIDLPGLYFELGVKMKNDGKAEEDIVSPDNISITTGGGFHVPKWMIKSFIDIFTTEICGSKCIYQRVNKNSNIKLVEINNAPHTFMLNEDGSFNGSYLRTRNSIYKFIKKNLKK